MKTKLYSQIVRTKVDTPVNKGKAKIVDILATKVKGSWEASEVKIETGLIGKEAKFFCSDKLENITKNGNVFVDVPIEQGNSNPIDQNEIYLSRLVGNKVETDNGHELGKIYDYEILIGTDPWKVWKLLIDPSGLSPLKRRIRIHTKHIKKITSDRLILDKNYKGV